VSIKCLLVVNYFKDNTLRPDISLSNEFFGLNELPLKLKHKLVQPSATVGLNEELANSAIQILKASERLVS
jgi:hypothetical protein